MVNILFDIIFYLFLAIPFLSVGGLTLLAVLKLWEIPKIGKVLSLTFTGIVTFGLVIAFWPFDSHYIDEFHNATGIDLHETTEVLAKETSTADLQGDYRVTAVLRTIDFDHGALSLVASPEESCTIPDDLEPHVNAIGSESLCWQLNSKPKRLSMWIVYLTKEKLLYYSVFKD